MLFPVSDRDIPREGLGGDWVPHGESGGWRAGTRTNYPSARVGPEIPASEFEDFGLPTSEVLTGLCAARGRGGPRAFEAFQVTGRVRAVSGLGDF